MADYTPATPQVRAAYIRAMRNAFIASAAEHEAEFDRWLAGALADAERSVIEAHAAVKACKALIAATDTQHAQMKAESLEGAAEALEQRWVEHEPLTTLETIAFLRGWANEHRAERSQE